MSGPFDDGMRQGDAPMAIGRPVARVCSCDDDECLGECAGSRRLTALDQADDDHRLCACGARWLLCPDRIVHCQASGYRLSTWAWPIEAAYAVADVVHGAGIPLSNREGTDDLVPGEYDRDDWDD